MARWMLTLGITLAMSKAMMVKKGKALIGTIGADNEFTPGTKDEGRNILFVGSEEETSERRCVKKVMMVEETVMDEIETCDHTYDKQCHSSYVTRYDSVQEEECGERFEKKCFIKNEKKYVSEMVEVCRTPVIKDCEVEGEPICKTVYESECWTKQIMHEVEDDVPACKTVMEEKCEDIAVGYTTKQKCDSWPREVCTVERKKTKKTTPKTGCDKVPKLLCAPAGCGTKEGSVECRRVPKKLLIDDPKEECELNPIRACKFVTKLVPRLELVESCINVPKEICSKSKTNPQRIKKPIIKKWCFKPSNITQITDEEKDKTEDCSDCELSGICDIENQPYTKCSYCKDHQCVPGCKTDLNCPFGYHCFDGDCRSGPGKVLVNSINIKTKSCIGCSNEGVKVSLTGEVIGEFLNGVPCSTNTLDHEDSLDFSNGNTAMFDGHDADGNEVEVEKKRMGACYKAPLNAQVRGGFLTWKGNGQWVPESVCVDWRSSNMAFMCDVEEMESQVWKLVECRDLTPRQKCHLEV